jgi:hypothetical protein
MQTPRRVHLAYGVAVEAVHDYRGWHALRFTGAGSVGGSFQSLSLDAPPQLAGRTFTTTKELAAAALSWLEKHPG